MRVNNNIMYKKKVSCVLETEPTEKSLLVLAPGAIFILNKNKSTVVDEGRGRQACAV